MAKKTLKIGARAPSFTLKNYEGQKISRKDFEGKWIILYFYPKDNTSGCTLEAKEFSSELSRLRRMGAEVIGISTDSAESHQGFIKLNKLKHHLLCDPTHVVLDKFGAWGQKVTFGKKTTGPIRSTVLIDPQGKIAYHWAKVKPAGHAEAVKHKLSELKKAG